MEPTASISVSGLPGVTPRLTDKLSRLDIHSLQDLIFHLPVRYQNRTRITPLGQVRPGQALTVEGEVVQSELASRRRPGLNVVIKDDTGLLTLRFFHFYRKQQQELAKGRRLRCFGETRAGRHGCEMIHPEYQSASLPLERALTPIYPLTQGVSQALLRRLIRSALGRLEELPLQDPLSRKTAMPIQQALMFLHAPPPDADLETLEMGQHPAQQRLALEELLAHQVSMRRLRRRADRQKAQTCMPDTGLMQRFRESLPFSLTAGQEQVVGEIFQDLGKATPMMRLLQGDVGSGKTVVSALCALAAISSGHQVALMAPTEILAEQHYLTFSQWFLPLNIEVAYLTGKVKGRKRDERTEGVRTGTTQMVVGTHALLQESLEFHDLALVIIDEQHRFGVGQRLSLRNKAQRSTDEGRTHPHQLIMTATPIPRTLAMTTYADLDLSTIRSLPPGRSPVTTSVINNERRTEIIERLRDQCQRGVQAYWVCALIEESEAVELQSTERLYGELSALLPELSIAVLHGRTSSADKTDIMWKFKQQEIQLLVSTTVIEVGVDIPNATLMIIENAERFGLAQLHQLRGRVGRGHKKGHCVLLYESPLSGIAKKRLATLRDTTDGFAIAERDLELRGPGEVLGTRQTGDLQFRVADLIRDQQLLKIGRQLIKTLKEPEEEILLNRWLAPQMEYASA